MENDREKFNVSINKILKCVKNGDKNKMDELFLKSFNHFYAYALYRTYNKTRAEDAVMGMYENILKYIDSFDPDKGGVGWMVKILNRVIYNLNSDEFDKKKHEQAIEDDINATQLNDIYETIGLAEAVSDLSDSDKQIVFLYYFERRTLNEIANKVKLSSSAVHKRLQQILKKLKKVLE
ncbi:sigma-70 family RNA polymerase sigma factor [Anaerocaecibacter muris]|uniref:RNA polymerase sigma factor n=1 Tax=Anaerocaecibacter muris TaxID=2941513 RepID=UPI003084597D